LFLENYNAENFQKLFFLKTEKKLVKENEESFGYSGTFYISKTFLENKSNYLIDMCWKVHLGFKM